MKMKIGICQLKVAEDVSVNLKRASDIIKTLAERGAEIVILPEMFCCPYDINLFPKYAQYAEESNSYFDFLSNMAKISNALLIGGSVPERYNGKIYNSSLIFDKNGRILAKHRKIHLFDVNIKGGIVFTESEEISPGDSLTVVKTDKINIGVGICYDVRFPELAVKMAEKGASLLVYPGAFNHITGPAHWELLARARALDAQSYVCMTAPALNEELVYKSYGHSILCDPWGNVKMRFGYEEEADIGVIDTAVIDKVRAELPVLNGRRPDIYRG